VNSTGQSKRGPYRARGKGRRPRQHWTPMDCGFVTRSRRG
jgi:hypothetical protein